MYVFEDECEHAGIDPKRVASIARRISRAAVEARALGIHIFGGSGGSLRWSDDPDHMSGNLVLAHLDGSYDGGDGAERTDENGLLRGESAR